MAQPSSLLSLLGKTPPASTLTCIVATLMDRCVENDPIAVGQPVALFHEWNDRSDPNARSVWLLQAHGWRLLGYLSVAVSTLIAEDAEKGFVISSEIFQCHVAENAQGSTATLQVLIQSRSPY